MKPNHLILSILYKTLNHFAYLSFTKSRNMRQIIAIFIFLFLTSFQSTTGFKRHFDHYHLKGSIVIYDTKNHDYHYYDSTRCNEGFIPAGTFKILNSLIALDNNLIEDTSHVIPWDSVDRGWRHWNRNQTLVSAFKTSLSWVYQDFAKQIGEEKMKKYLKENRYGNESIQGGIDQFWLTGGLRVSQIDQINFLRRLYIDDLKFSKENHKVVKDMMLTEETEDFQLYASSGWGYLDHVNYGWYIGWLKTHDNLYFFATNIETSSNPPEPKFGIARRVITMMALRDIGAIKGHYH